MPASLSSLLKDVRVALSAFDAGVYSGADCAVLAEELATTEKACASARLLAAARAVEAGAHKQRGFSDGAAWVARQSGTTAGRARQALDTASRLGDCPDTRGALLSGDISLDQAREITQMPFDEKQLLSAARDGDLSQVRDAARQLRQAHTDPAQLRRRQFGLREFRHWQDTEGMIRFTGALPPETGLPFVRRVELAAQRLHQAAKKTGGAVERFEKYAADALAQLLADDEGGAGLRGRTIVELVLVSDLNAWRRGHALPGEVCHIVGGGPIPVGIARELAKDPLLKVVIHDGVNIHLVKHFRRHVPAELRTALDLGGPPHFQGRRCERCGSVFRLERDHDDPLNNGGATEKSNLQYLCYSCHQVKTEEDRKAGLLGPSPPGRPLKQKPPPGEEFRDSG